MMMKNIFLILIVAFGIFTFTDCIAQFPVGKHKRYKGNLIVSVYDGNTTMYKFECLMYNEYILEPQITFEEFTSSTYNKDGTVTPDKNIRKNERLDGYTLNNLNDSTCSIFDKNAIKPTFKSIIPFRKKTGGLVLVKNVKEIKDYLGDFVFLKDTIIDKVTYRIFVCNLAVAKQKMQGFKKIVLYSNNSLKDFPYHPISRTLDEKFGGLIDRLVYVADDGHTLSVEYKYEAGLSKQDESKIIRFIAGAKQSVLKK